MTSSNDTACRSTNESGVLESGIAVVGLSALLSTLLIYSATVTPFQRFDGTSLFVGTFAEVSLAASVIISLFFACMILFGRRLPLAPLMMIGGAFYLLGAAAFIYLVFSETSNSMLTVVAALSTALGNVALCLIWGRIFKRYRLKEALILVALGCITSAIICKLLSVLPPTATIALFLACSVATIVMPSFLKTPSSGAMMGAAGSNVRKALETLRTLADVIIAPALGLLFFAFVMGVMREAFTESYNSHILATVVASAILIFYALYRTKRFAMRAIHQTFIPLFAVVLLTATSITSSLGQGSSIAMFLIFLLYTFAATLTLATLCAIANAAEFSSDLIFSMAVFLFALASIGGLVSSEFLSANMVSVVVTIATTVYAFSMVLYPYLKWQQETTWEIREEKSETESLLERCTRIATEHHLTTREQEILSYLAEGHNGTYISEALFISPNTVRTHIHNIYRKLDVTSREDILRLTRQNSDQV